MIEERDLFERAVRLFPPPERSLERLVERKDRKRRNSRLTAGVVAVAVAVAGIGFALRAFDEVPTTVPQSPPALTGNGDVTFVGPDSSELGRLILIDPASGASRELLDAGCAGSGGDTTPCRAGVRSVDWSPNGTHITYSLSGTQPGGIGASSGIYVMEVGTGEIRQLTSCVGTCWRQEDVEWSPDGSRIAFTEVTTAGCNAAWSFTGSCAIVTIDTDGTNRARLPTGPVVDPVNPTWSPDGTHIAFSGRVGSEWFVYTMATDGSALARIAEDLHSPNQNQPAWSPDGSRIAFLMGRTRMGDVELWSVSPDGSERRVLTRVCCVTGGAIHGVEGPTWSPDGTRIVILDATSRLLVIDAETGDRHVIGEALGPVAWQPVPGPADLPS